MAIRAVILAELLLPWWYLLVSPLLKWHAVHECKADVDAKSSAVAGGPSGGQGMLAWGVRHPLPVRGTGRVEVFVSLRRADVGLWAGGQGSRLL